MNNNIIKTNIRRSVGALMTMTLLSLTSPVSAATETLVYDFTAPISPAGSTSQTYPSTPIGPAITATGYGGEIQNTLQGLASSTSLGLGITAVTGGAIGWAIQLNSPQEFGVQLNIANLLSDPNLVSFTLQLDGFSNGGDTTATWNVVHTNEVGSLGGLVVPDGQKSTDGSTGATTLADMAGDTLLSIFTEPTMFSAPNPPDPSVHLFSLSAIVNVPVVAVPEPGTYLVLGSMLGIATVFQMRKRARVSS